MLIHGESTGDQKNNQLNQIDNFLSFVQKAGNLSGSYSWPMTFDIQMTLALLQELLLSLRANDPDGFKGWLAEGVHELGEPAVIELMLDGLNPILTTDEADRLVGWHLGVSI